MRLFTIVMVFAGLTLQAWCAGAEALADLAKWKLEDKVCVPEAIEKLVQETALDQRGPIEDALIAVAGSAEATPEARDFACRMLQRIGTKKCVPVLAGLLVDKDLSHFARLALQRMVDSSEAGQALKDALGKADDSLKVGIIASLGERRDEGTAALLQPLVGNADAAVASAAFMALGKIGGSDVLKFIQGAKAVGPVTAVRLDALLVCAGGLDGKEAANAYAAVYMNEKSDAHRAGALIGLVRTDDSQAASIVLDLIRGEDSYLRRTALSCVANEKSVVLTRAVTGVLKDLTPENRTVLIGLLAVRGDPSAVDGVAGFLQDADKGVRDAAILTVGALGNGQHVPLLLKAANDEATKETALTALASMTAANTDEALIAALRDETLVISSIKAIMRRDCASAVPELMRLAKTGADAVRNEAWTALGTTASAAEMDAMMAALLEITDGKSRGTAGDAVKNACSLSRDKQACFDAALKHYGKADEDTKAFIIDLASVTGGQKALDLVRSALKADNKALYDKAVRSLCAWPEPNATTDLMDLARNAPDEKTRIVALRGYLAVAEREGNEKKRAKLYADVRDLVKRADEKRLLVSKLGKIRDTAAVSMLSEYLDDAEVREEAGAAAVDLAKAVGRGARPEHMALVDKVLATCKDKGVLNRAKGVRNGMEK